MVVQHKRLTQLNINLEPKMSLKKNAKKLLNKKKLSRRNDVTSKNFITHYAKAFNVNNKVKRACDPYR